MIVQDSSANVVGLPKYFSSTSRELALQAASRVYEGTAASAYAVLELATRFDKYLRTGEK